MNDFGPQYRRTINHYHRKFRQKAAELNHPRPLPDYLVPMVAGRKSVRILDLGSGPFTTVGTQYDGVDVEVVAADILAPKFAEMYTEFGITPLVPVEAQDMGQLTYEPESFDIVHCVNALDHVAIPLMALGEMWRVCRTPGWIYLGHLENEGQRNGYGGLHHYNICLRKGQAWISTADYEECLDQCYPFVSRQQGRWIISVARKYRSRDA